MGDFLGNCARITKGVSTLILRESVKARALVETEKIASEYLNNSDQLVSKIEVFWPNSEKASFKLGNLISQFVLFQYSRVNISEKRKISWGIAGSLQGM